MRSRPKRTCRSPTRRQAVRAPADAEHEIAGQHAGWPAEVDERDGALVGIDGEEALRGG